MGFTWCVFKYSVLTRRQKRDFAYKAVAGTINMFILTIFLSHDTEVNGQWKVTELGKLGNLGL